MNPPRDPLAVVGDLLLLGVIGLTLRALLKDTAPPQNRVGWCWLHGLVEHGGCLSCQLPYVDPDANRRLADALEARAIAKWGADAS